MTTDDPPRLTDPDGGAPELLALALNEAREDLPSDDRIASLAAKLAPFLGGSGGGGGGGGGGAHAAAGTSAAVVKAISGAAVSLALIVGGVSIYGAFREPPPAEAPSETAGSNGPSAPAATERETPREPSREPSTEDLGPAPDVAPEEEKARRVAHPAPAIPAQSPDEELRALEQAQDVLDTAPGRAFESTESLRRRYPNGALAQEREVIAIDALLRLGRRPDAEARATRFRDRYPGSSQLRRIDALLAR